MILQRRKANITTHWQIIIWALITIFFFFWTPHIFEPNVVNKVVFCGCLTFTGIWGIYIATKTTDNKVLKWALFGWNGILLITIMNVAFYTLLVR